MNFSDTVCAPATSVGTGAVSMVRVSGPDSLAIVDKVVRFRSGSASESRGYTLKYGEIPDVDEVVAGIYRAPHSYTGEDSVELCCHASAYIVGRILELLTDAGCRLAEAGEFTRRAFVNGKMDLAQAEAVADVIASGSEVQHRVAMNQLRGGYSEELGKIRAELLELTSLMELELDFSEEEVEFADRSRLAALLDDAISRCTALADSFRVGNAIRNGVPVAIVGAPNSGKSTLLNALLHDERAIVSDVPGTTRDTVEETCVIGGVLFRFIDTAGIRETADKVERLGIERSFSKAAGAEVVLGVVDVWDAFGCGAANCVDSVDGGGAHADGAVSGDAGGDPGGAVSGDAGSAVSGNAGGAVSGDAGGGTGLSPTESAGDDKVGAEGLSDSNDSAPGFDGGKLGAAGSDAEKAGLTEHPTVDDSLTAGLPHCSKASGSTSENMAGDSSVFGQIRKLVEMVDLNKQKLVILMNKSDKVIGIDGSTATGTQSATGNCLLQDESDAAGFYTSAEEIPGTTQKGSSATRCDEVDFSGHDSTSARGFSGGTESNKNVAAINKFVKSLVSENDAPEVLWISAKRGFGLDKLRELLASAVGKASADGVLVTNARHAAALRDAAASLRAVRSGLGTLTTDLLAEDLRSALASLGSITGEITTDEVLGEIFRGFCIGK